ncbi:MULTISPECIES: Uma2 family endonuclease [unclassified Microcoleus]|uniref:Uma2 family endonuclease n=1 Tax=unclassified Microcoleus TaxID=2642155 RepID=UPI001D3168C1|nr:MULTISPECIES: Uma2 family endonuclease [unclassified Microcoleus]MCC3502684.1 Uma2 family endonuclease [Microcoleus sp. PH2017_19_SFW_U_A]TAG75887.1 MAG: Uma2 family endonuclease [Oscillatoriales cyanobacterium]MCC3471692.1 Uma2 family endonuclease [Microcoleus sp. PH2017_13_LAR_U_A]MCC3484822.1 Uma2 family endonuclease [Microcoleus sp. PH2017_14_LAR_D_A]MCC3520926.1 Uma2 family endonuclease [Microcoleus sp. PH2017_20_SFW_D_A]
MTAVVPTLKTSEIIYPSADGEPVAETYDHLYAILTTLEVLKQYLADRRATVLANQFLYYAQGFPKVRLTPDVMVIFDVEPGGRDNYKIWEEGQVPKVIFEMTSPSTQSEDKVIKKDLYERLEVQEYWLFDPKGEWIPEKLRGYRLGVEGYQIITDSRCEVLQLRLEIEGKLIGFYREDNGEKLLTPDELASALKAERQRAEAERQHAEVESQRAQSESQRAAELESLLARYREQFGKLP